MSGSAQILIGDCVEEMASEAMPADSVDAIVTDPPYGLEFMGKEWDKLEPNRSRYKGKERQDLIGTNQGPGAAFDSRMAAMPNFGSQSRNPRCENCGKFRWDHVGRKCECDKPTFKHKHMGNEQQAFHETWACEAFRVLKPGGYLLAFSGTRTAHRMVCAIEDAGFEIRDRILHIKGEDGRRIPACECGGLAVPYTHSAGREEIPEYDVRPMRDADIPTPESALEERWEVLRPGVPEQSTPEQGATRPESEVGGTEQPGMEGRGNVQTEQGQLHRPEVRKVSGGIPADGSQGRVHHGASPSDGEASGPSSQPDRGSASQGPQHSEQQHREPAAIQDEWRTQTCGRCGKALPSLRGGDAIESMPADLAWVYGSG